MNNKKFLFAVISLVLAFVMSLSVMTVFAVESDDTIIPDPTDATQDITVPTTGDEQGDDTPGGTDEVQYKAGDVDGNGVIDINDVTTYQLTLAGKQQVTAAFTKNSETVTDSKRNITDATGIQYYVANVFKKLPVTPDGYYSEIIRP